MAQKYSPTHILEYILIGLLIAYIVMGAQISPEMAEHIDTPIGKMVMAAMVLILFAYSTPILGILALVVVYHIIKEARQQTGTYAMEKYYPTETSKWSPFSPRHQFPYTLEQEMVKKMAPQKFNTNYKKAPYKPVLEDNHDAAYVYDDVSAK